MGYRDRVGVPLRGRPGTYGTRVLAALLEHVEKLEAVITDRLAHDTKMVEIRKEYNGCLIRPE